MMSDGKKDYPPPPKGFRRVFVKEVTHWRSKKKMVRKNGGWFSFLVRC